MHADCDGEDFVLLDCEDWSDEQRSYFERENENFSFFKDPTKFERRIVDFP